MITKQQHFRPAVQDLVSEFDIYSFTEAVHYHSHLFLGCHLVEYAGLAGLQFTLWAPGLKAVSLAGDFNSWSISANPLSKVHESGLWSVWIPNLKLGTKYQYVLHQADGTTKFINDPYAKQVSFDTRLSSIAVDEKYNWNDTAWIKQREATEFSKQAVSILSFDLLQYFARAKTYQELAKIFVAEAKTFGATHIELNNFLEAVRNLDFVQDKAEAYTEYHYFSSLSVYGAVEDFKCLVDYCHQNGIGVILKLPYYEEENFAVFGNFKNLTKNQHRNFYLSNIVYWLEEFHVDGFNFSSIEALIYKSNNPDIKDFLQSLNQTIHARSAGVFTVARDSTGYPGLTKPSFMEGCGFNMKINLFWLNEMKKFFAVDGYDLIDFVYSTINIFAENFLLTLPDKDDWQHLSFEDMKLLLAFFFFMPGKKHVSFNLLETIAGQIQERDFAGYILKLNNIYKHSKTLYETDFREAGFEWLEYDAKAAQASFLRWSRDFSKTTLVIFNFADETTPAYTLGVPKAGFYKQIFSSENIELENTESDGAYSSNIPLHNRPYSIALDLPAQSVTVLELT